MGSFSVTELEETLMTDDDERKREEKNLYGEAENCHKKKMAKRTRARAERERPKVKREVITPTGSLSLQSVKCDE